MRAMVWNRYVREVRATGAVREKKKHWKLEAWIATETRGCRGVGGHSTGSRCRGATAWRGRRGEMTGGRLHHGIRHSSSLPSLPSLPSPLFSFFARNLRISSSFASLSSTLRHAAFRNVTPVTDWRCRGRDNNNCQRSNVPRVSYDRETNKERIKMSMEGRQRGGARVWGRARKKGYEGERDTERERKDRETDDARTRERASEPLYL